MDEALVQQPADRLLAAADQEHEPVVGPQLLDRGDLLDAHGRTISFSTASSSPSRSRRKTSSLPASGTDLRDTAGTRSPLSSNPRARPNSAFVYANDPTTRCSCTTMSKAGIVASCACIPSQSAQPPGPQDPDRVGTGAARTDSIDGEIRPGASGGLEHGLVQVLGRDDDLGDVAQAQAPREDGLAHDHTTRARGAQELRRKRADGAAAEHHRRARELLGNE